jgi:RNA polymerase sigma-70 factor (family 1)
MDGFKNDQYDDKKLFSLITKDDGTAFTQIFHKYNTVIFPFVLKILKSKYLAEETVQEIFLNLWKKRAHLNEVENPKAYLYSIATNCALNQLKKLATNTKNINELYVATRNNEAAQNPSGIMDAKEMANLIAAAVQQLPPQRQLVYKLSRHDGKSYKEIGHILNISTKTVQAHLVEAVKSIKRILQAYFILHLFLLF